MLFQAQVQAVVCDWRVHSLTALVRAQPYHISQSGNYHITNPYILLSSHTANASSTSCAHHLGLLNLHVHTLGH
jgi:hypothetical protein